MGRMETEILWWLVAFNRTEFVLLLYPNPGYILGEFVVSAAS